MLITALKEHCARTWRVVGPDNLQVREACLQCTVHLEIRSPAAWAQPARVESTVEVCAPVRSGGAERDVNLAAQAEHVQRRRRGLLQASVKRERQDSHGK